MRTYFEPEMKIAVFDVINCATSSNNVEGNFDTNGTNKVYGKGDFGGIMSDSKDTVSIPASMN